MDDRLEGMEGTELFAFVKMLLDAKVEHELWFQHNDENDVDVWLNRDEAESTFRFELTKGKLVFVEVKSKIYSE